MDQTEFKFPDEKASEQTKQAKDDAVEFEIEVVDDTPDPDKGRKPLEEPVGEVTDDELSKYDEGVQRRIKKLSHGYHDERRAKEAALREREEALRFAQRIIDENNSLKKNLGDHTTLLVGTARQNAEFALEQARSKYKAAYDAGDADQIVAAQEEMTQAKLRLDKVENFRPPPLQERQVPVNMQSQSVPENKADPKALAWREENQWFGRNRLMTAFTLGLHEQLVEEGVDPTSDDYYEKINKTVRSKFPESFSDEEKPKRTSSNVVAPASRNVAPKKITLTQTQVALAKKLKVPLKLYAEKVAEGMTQNG
ncbi:MAG: hypothetical protein EB115_13370 [Betaproteobacteria bacterium]|nr:hypothetical protein [Betaproteobacteria bacterium]